MTARPIDLRTLDEWMYAIGSTVRSLEAEDGTEALAILRRTLDDMRERREQLYLRRHNEVGY